MEKLCDDCKKIFSDYYSLKTYADEISSIDIKLSQLNSDKNANIVKSTELSVKASEVQKKIDKANAKVKELTAEANKTN